MSIGQQIIKSFRETYYGGNWTGSNLKDALQDVSWHQATTKVYSFNTIAALVFHINYYIEAAIRVLEGGNLDAHDKFSYDLPHIHSQEDWEKLLNKIWSDAERYAALVEKFPDELILKEFVDAKYGNYFRNLTGITEHAHYHLGQIVLIKKIIMSGQHQE